jgi:hypothetical protein
LGVEADAGATLTISRLDTARMAMSSRAARSLILSPTTNTPARAIKAFL